jgi:hypothetical protein
VQAFFLIPIRRRVSLDLERGVSRENRVVGSCYLLFSTFDPFLMLPCHFHSFRRSLRADTHVAVGARTATTASDALVSASSPVCRRLRCFFPLLTLLLGANPPRNGCYKQGSELRVRSPACSVTVSAHGCSLGSFPCRFRGTEDSKQQQSSSGRSSCQSLWRCSSIYGQSCAFSRCFVLILVHPLSDDIVFVSVQFISCIVATRYRISHMAALRCVPYEWYLYCLVC